MRPRLQTGAGHRQVLTAKAELLAAATAPATS